jgi:hypothetical protein
VLRWNESGGPLVKPPTRKGFGSHMMEAMIRANVVATCTSTGALTVFCAKSSFRPGRDDGPDAEMLGRLAALDLAGAAFMAAIAK